METVKILLQADESNYEETPIKIAAGKLSKSRLIIFMLLLIVLMSSCFVRTPGHERHEARHQHNERHD